MVGPKIYLGGNLVVASGALAVPKGQVVEIIPIPAGLAPLRFRFTFETVAGDATRTAGGEIVGNMVPIRLINFDNPGGSALISPMLVGHIGGRNLRLTLTVTTIGPPDTAMKVFAYTFTLDGPLDA